MGRLIKIIFLLALILSGCGDNHGTKKSEFSFPQVIEVSGKEVFYDELTLSIERAGPYLLFEQDRDAKGNDLYHVYSASDHEFLGVVGHTGQVPYGFIGAQYCGQYYKNSEGNTVFWVNDAPKRRISAINIEKSLVSEFVVIDDYADHEPRHDFMNALYVLDSNNLAGHQPGYIRGSNEYPFYFLKREEEPDLVPYGEYPEVKNLETFPQGENSARGLKYLSTVMKPDKSMFAYAYRWYDRLDIFDREGKFVAEITHPEKYQEYNASNIFDFSLEDPMINTTYYYQDLGTTDNLIFALYFDKRHKVNESKGSQIRVFSWSGELICLIKCEDDLFSITVDEANGKFYGYDMSSESFKEYDITELFE